MEDHRTTSPAPGAVLDAAVLLASTDKAQREKAYASGPAEALPPSMLSVAEECAVALVGDVLCADASCVDGAEAQRASLLLGRLMLLDRAVTVGLMREGLCLASWKAPSSALARVIRTKGTDWTHDDVMLAATDLLPDLVKWCQGMTDLASLAGLAGLDHFL
eukprot:SAG31_NODE_17685_length_661_cov_1.170819_1_plen_161_part_10